MGRIPMTSKQLVQCLIHSGHLNKLTLIEIAELTGYSSSVISRWHSKKKPPDIHQFVDWANALGFEVKLVRPDATTSIHT